MKLRLWKDSQSRQVAELAAELVHGVAGKDVAGTLVQFNEYELHGKHPTPF